MDEDIIDNWSDAADRSKAKRASNREESARLLTEAGFPFSSNNAGAHLIVSGPKSIVDFWPGTGKWIERGSQKTARGVFPLLKHLKAQS